MGEGGQRHAPAALSPGKVSRYPLYKRLGALTMDTSKCQEVQTQNTGCSLNYYSSVEHGKCLISKALEELNMFSTAHLPQNGVQCEKAMW